MTSDKAIESEATFFTERGFGHRIGFGERPALVLIDYINGFTNPSYPLGANLDTEIGASQGVLEAARAGGIPILFTTVQYDTVEGDFAGVWQRKQHGLATLRAGTPAVEIDERLAPVAGERTLPKTYASAFFGTDLLSWLVSQTIDTLLLLGCTTSGCVRATAVDAVQYGFRPMVIADGVGDRSPAAHRQALFDLDLKYADVVSLNETLRYLAKSSVTDRGR